jgi:glycosyltransferase involved in cell wall biosynthesis
MLLESAGLGLPIVCSRESNLPEVRTFNAGFVVNNEREAASSIKKILNDKKLSKSMSKNALALAKNFDIKKKTIELIEIYNSSI